MYLRSSTTSWGMRKVTLIIGRSLLSRLLSRSIFIASTLLLGRLAGGDDADRVLDLDVDHEEQASRAVEPDECVARLLLGARIDQLGEGIEERLGRLLEGHAVLVPVAGLAFVPNKGDSV